MNSSDDDHEEALAETGFWGRRGAGCVILAARTGRLLVGKRSDEVLEPGTWGTWGGAIDVGETPIEAVKREIQEEAGYGITSDAWPVFVPLYVFQAPGFAYHNYLAIIPEEFTPVLGAETDDYLWCGYGAWPSPLHFGLRDLLDNPASDKLIRAAIKQSGARPASISSFAGPS